MVIARFKVDIAVGLLFFIVVLQVTRLTLKDEESELSCISSLADNSLFHTVGLPVPLA